MHRITWSAAIVTTALLASVSLAQTPTRTRVAISHALPPLDGSRLKATVVEVTYGPGESSAAHSHPCPVVGYVIEGAIRSQVRGGPEVTYRASEAFYEAPDGHHVVSANASQQEPARFLAYFTCDRETALSVPVPGAAAH